MTKAIVRALIPLAFLSWSPPAAAQLVPDGPPFRVNQFTPNEQWRGDIDRDAAGNFVVVWQSLTQLGVAYDYEIVARRFASTGAPLGDEFVVNSAVAGLQSDPDVSVNAAGDFVVVWTDQPVSEVAGQRFDSTGSPRGGEFRVHSDSGWTHSYPSVALDDSGSFLVVWRGKFQPGSTGTPLARFFDSTGTPVGAQFRPHTPVRGYRRDPRATTDGAGGFLVTWAGDGPDPNLPAGIWSRKLDASATPVGLEFLVGVNGVHPSVARDGSGRFVVVWGRGLGDLTYGIYGQRVDPNGVLLGGEFQVHTVTPADLLTWPHYGPEVASDAAGNFVVVWAGDPTTGTWLEVFSRLFDSSGVPVGGELEISDAEPDRGHSPAVSFTSDGEVHALYGLQDPDAFNDPDFILRRYLSPLCSPSPGIVSDLSLDWAVPGSELLFTWTDTPAGDEYLLFEDSSPDGHFFDAAGSASSGIPGLIVPASPGTTYYLLAARNAACGMGALHQP